ncbi:hypothetical protein [Nannocystis exedens]|uniref:hypothetical protein n=1 Tax=Nannocystis exedens TaxID=54 RepID=UPI000BBA0C52|nr:hypothetical protein [Nannocystis exedens]
MDELVASSVVSPVSLVLVAVALVLADVPGSVPSVLSVPGSGVEVEVGTTVSAVAVASVASVAPVGSPPEVSLVVPVASVVEDAFVLVICGSSPQAGAAISTAQRRE